MPEYRSSLGGLALSHTIAQAILSGLISCHLAFFRTPKQVYRHGLLHAFTDAREESLLMMVLILTATAIMALQGDKLPDARIWFVVPFLQAVPYATALVLSILSPFPRLPATLTGEMGELR